MNFEKLFDYLHLIDRSKKKIDIVKLLMQKTGFERWEVDLFVNMNR